MNNILLAVTGSIACYKSFDLLRHLKKNSSAVKVKIILSKGSLKFLNPDLFKYLGVDDIYLPNDDFNTKFINPSQPVLHIELARWCDQFVLYPASANTLAKLSNGEADDLLSSVFLSLEKAKLRILFPAMNTQMFENPITQNNLSILEKLPNTTIYPPDSGELICGEKGNGKLPLPEEVGDFLLSLPKKKSNKTVTITTGGTLSSLDSVRYLTNPSSGITGFYMAQTFLKQGYKVNLIASKSSTSRIKHLEKNSHLSIYWISSTDEMYETAIKLFPKSDLYISSAAPCDLKFKNYSENKIKKSDLGNTLEVEKTPDILSQVLKLKKKHQKVVGFAAENPLSDEIIQKKLAAKPVDLLITNEVNSGLKGEIKGFAKNSAEYTIYQGIKCIEHKIILNKKDLAARIVSWYQKLEANEYIQNTPRTH